MRETLAVLAMSIGAVMTCACAGADDPEAARAKQRVWGRIEVASDVEERAKEALDPTVLDTNADLRKRVLQMSFEEVVARLQFVEYKGVARFNLAAGGKTLSVVEDTLIQHGIHGTFRVLQLDGDGEVTRETIHNNGVFYVRNGGGEMRVQGLGATKDHHLIVRDEAWQPLRVYTSYYGPRLGLTKNGTGNVFGRTATRYKLGLVDGPDEVTVEGIEGAKRPVSLSGELYVDDTTGVPIKASLAGVLEVLGKKEGGSIGKLNLSLDFTLKNTEGAEIKPKSFVPTIKRHPVDLEPLAFLDGGTRTSTVIGGKKPSTNRPPDTMVTTPSAIGAATSTKTVVPAKKPEAKPEAKQESTTTPKKKKKKKKK